MVSSPEHVYRWLEARAAKASEDRRFLHEGDEELERALLARNAPLIDLGLARFGLQPAIAKQLFARAESADVNQLTHARALRMAVLSNQALSKNSWDLPAVVIDGGDDDLARWIATAEHTEIAALFENPTVDDSFLRDFLEGKKTWEAMDEERRLQAVCALTKNERTRTPYDDRFFMDGWADYSYHSVFNAAWQLAETVPTQLVWAHALSSLYDRLVRKASSVENPLDVAERWYADPTDVKLVERESSANQSGYLGPYQNVRKGLAMLALAQDSAIGNDLMASDDIALRAGAYASMAMSPEQIVAAYQRDGEIAVNCAVYNLEVWHKPETRQALRGISWQAVHDDQHADLMAANIFNTVEERMKKEHPDWFKDEGYEMEISDQPSSKSDIARAVESLDQLKMRIDAADRRLGWVFWLSLIAMGASLRHLL